MAFALLRVWAISKEFCIRIKVSMSMPKAFSNPQSHVAGEIGFGIQKASVGRATRKILAPSVTERSCASMISDLRKRPDEPA